MEITYKTIKPLIKKEEISGGNQIHLEFCAKNQDVPITTVAVVIPDTNRITKNVAKQVVKSTIINTLINQISRFLGIRGSLIRSVGQNLANQNNASTGMINTEITPEKKQKAIVDAFKPFMAMYKFNQQTSEWEYK